MHGSFLTVSPYQSSRVKIWESRLINAKPETIMWSSRDDAVDASETVCSLLQSGEDMTKLKTNHLSTELLKLPRFGAKLNSAPKDSKRLQQRLDKIYRCKEKAFRHPRYREVSFEKSDETRYADAGKVGVLNTADMTVRVEKFRGSFSQFFGVNRFDAISGSQYTLLTPLEAFFLADMGILEICVSDSSGETTNQPTTLSIEDLRAMFEKHVSCFAERYGIFSEIHRTTQLCLRPYGDLKWSKDCNKRTAKQKSWSQGCVLDVECKTQPEVSQCLLPSPYIEESSACGSASTEWCHGSHAASSKPELSLEPAASLEIPPLFEQHNWRNINYATAVEDARLPAGSIPSSFDLAFTAFGKSEHAGSMHSVFDVAVTDYHKTIPLADLFAAVRGRSNPDLPLYVARSDCSSSSGFAVLKADIPSVVYEDRKVSQ
ncbi:uncharacterized protein LOC129581141 [Paramacrobiotus metropolitanus]|uniref:uncharacterized protein LOC129581141 n=1 Tax=Paramacrobiotus metropolitanus TaxID=2943436 RepID=UPI002445CFFA|nr:uncharacterized protein LOC129581141 [Paramacrobiotus metropolitanus]